MFDHEVDTEEMYFAGIDTRKSAVRVPTRPVKMVRNGTEPVSVASAFYNNMAGLLPGTLPGGNDSILASPVLSTSLKCGNKICDRLETESSQPVIITLLHTIYVQVCVLVLCFVVGQHMQVLHSHNLLTESN